MKTFTSDGDNNINSDGNSYLSFYRIFGSAVEGVYSQMLLEPFEEQFDLPATLVKVGNRQWWKKKRINSKRVLLL